MSIKSSTAIDLPKVINNTMFVYQASILIHVVFAHSSDSYWDFNILLLWYILFIHIIRFLFLYLQSLEKTYKKKSQVISQDEKIVVFSMLLALHKAGKTIIILIYFLYIWIYDDKKQSFLTTHGASYTRKFHLK